MKRYLILIVTIVLMLSVSGCGQNISFKEDGTAKTIADKYPEYEFSYDSAEKIVYLKLFTNTDIGYVSKEIVYKVADNNLMEFTDDMMSVINSKELKEEIIIVVEETYKELSKEYKINDVICNVYNDTRELQGTYSYNNYWE